MVRIESIADHLDLIPTIARWHWDEWGHADPHGSLESWTAALRRRTNREQVPMTFVALDGETPLGSVTLVENDMSHRPDLAHLPPWVAGTYVVESVRGQEVGSALMTHVVEQGRRMGIECLHLYTSTAERFYAKLGWTTIDRTRYEGEDVAIMTLEL